ncbi:MAG: pilus assembly protein TadG-related protein, partial [Sulfurimicrobium sp.]|nr:pilus assembly protein TadG-related protein [Sulfurimicrobium sp.]
MSQYIQHGQALPLALVLFVAVAATVFFMFNSGQLVQEKIRLTNTADAVVYSAGVFEARVLNYDAYTNRAIIANEIAIGHAVGLASWAKYAGTTADTIAPYMYLIPYAGAAIADALYEVRDAIDVYTPLLAYTVTLHDAAINALAASQLAVHGPGNAVALASRKVLMDEVAHKNDPDVKVDLLPV